MTKEEHEAIEKLSVKIDNVLAQCALCTSRAATHHAILFENSRRMTGLGVSPAGLVTEHHGLMAAYDNANVIKRGIWSGVTAEAGKMLAMAVIMGGLLLVQSRLSSTPNTSSSTTTVSSETTQRGDK